MNKVHPRLLLIDMMSGANDYGRDLVLSLSTVSDLTVVTVDDSPLVSTENSRVLPVFPAFGGRGSIRIRLSRAVVAFAVLARELWRHRRDSVHIQFFRFGLVDMTLYLAFLPFLRMLVYTAHNALPHEAKYKHKVAYRIWYRSVHKIHVLSNYAKNQILMYSGISSDHVEVIPHGNYASLVDRSIDMVPILKREIGVADENCLALIFGLVREYKGVDRVIEALAKVSKNLPLTVLVAGKCDDLQLLNGYKKRVHDLGLDDRIIFRPGVMSDEELVGFIRTCDITIFPYRHIYQSGALMLAMTFGKSILASDIEGFREYVDHNENAWLCDTSNPDDFAEGLTQLITDSDKRNRLARAAGQKAAAAYAWPILAKNLANLYVDKKTNF